MLDRLADWLEGAKTWQIVALSIIASEILTVISSAAVGYALWGSFPAQTFFTGVLDSFLDPLLVVPPIILVIYRLRDRVELGIKKAKDDLERRVGERTAELKASEEKYRVLLEQASEGITVADGALDFVVANLKACEMFGYSPEEFLKMNIRDLCRDEDLEDVLSCIEEMQSGKAVIKERILRRKDGSHIPVEISAKRLDDGRIQAFMRDITERKAEEEEKERIQAQLIGAKKMEAIGTLAGGIAHDFNNLLTVIKGDCEIALSETDPDDTVFPQLRQIQKAAARAADLTRKLLLFSRQKSMSPVYLNLNKTVDEMFKMLKRLIGEDISISLDLEPEPWSVYADPISVEQVLMNLAVNARDAMKGGGRLIIKTENAELREEDCASVPGSRAGRFVRLMVTDNGTGMDSETLQHIFDPFYSARDGGKGTGLGLSVVHGIIEQHGGWITVESEPGKGSTFGIYLEGFDVKPDDEIMWSFSPGGAREAADLPRGNGERILLIEDEEGVSRLVERTLANNGYTVFPAFNAEEAMEIFEREDGNFNLVFSDVVLPGESGIGLVEKIRARKPGMQVLMSSGYTDQKSQWPVIREKGYRFLEKPYELADLLKAVREAI